MEKVYVEIENFLIYSVISTIFFAGVSTSSPMGDNIRMFFEKLRDRMHMDMTDTIGIPRLDPFTTDRLEFDGNTLDLGK